jgi:uncharacterized protein
VGDPTLRAKKVLEVRGISTLLSGKYYATDAKHVISSAGFVVELKLTRDGTGTRRRAGAATRGQPQGGQPNRAAPAATGALTEVERIDPESGRSFLQYRREGSALGAADPEARARVPR